MGSQRKHTILNVAIRLFARDGFAATTFERIAAEAGVAFGLIRYHFGSKEKIFLAANLHVLDALAGRLRQAAVDDDGRDAVEGCVRAYLDFARDPDSHYDIFITCTHLDQVKEEENRRPLAAKWEEIFSVLTDAIEAGVERGVYSADLVPADTARFIFCTLSGAARGMRFFLFPENPFQDQIILHILRGLGSPAAARADASVENPDSHHPQTTPHPGGIV